MTIVASFEDRIPCMWNKRSYDDDLSDPAFEAYSGEYCRNPLGNNNCSYEAEVSGILGIPKYGYLDRTYLEKKPNFAKKKVP